MKQVYIFVSIAVSLGLLVGAYMFGINNTQSSSVLLDGPAFAAQYAATLGAVLLDVRTPVEYAGGAIPGAQLLDYSDPSFESAVAKLPKDKTYFVYCRSGNRSSHAVQSMRSAGISSIYELRGGVSTWATLLGSSGTISI